MEVLTEGRRYKLHQLGGETQILDIEHLWYRRNWLHRNILTPSGNEPEWNLRQALYFYEVRAFWRKRQALNRLNPSHVEEEALDRGGEGYFNTPFSPLRTWKDGDNIEDLPIGEDGHIKLEGLA